MPRSAAPSAAPAMLVPLLLLLGLLTPTAWGSFCYPDPHTSCWPTAAALSKFAKGLSAHAAVRTPVDSDYPAAALSMNSLKASFPALIVYPATEADVSHTVAFAAKYKIRLVVKCSGHDYDDRSTGVGIIQLNVNRLTSLHYDPATTILNVGGGVSFGPAYKYAEEVGRAIVGGGCKTVCFAGFLMGGGRSDLSPQYGLGADSVIDIRFALFNGTVITASPTQHADLFNALWGSGASTYGVLVSLRYRTHPAPAVVTYLTGNWPLPPVDNPTMPSILDYLLNVTWFQGKPLALVADNSIMNQNTGVVAMKWVYTGASWGSALHYLAPLFALPGFNMSEAKTTNFSSLYELDIVMYPPPSGIWAREFVSSLMIPQTQSILDEIKLYIIAHQHVTDFQILYNSGGAVANFTVGSLPTGFRHALAEFRWGSFWLDPGEDHGHMTAVSAVTADLFAMVPISYVNKFTTWGGKYNLMPDWKTRLYSGYKELLVVKKRYDPCNLYSVQYGVASDLPTATCCFEG